MASLILPLSVQAAPNESKIVIKNHRFAPAEVTEPAGQKAKLLVENRDTTSEEFESHAMNREKMIPAGGKAIVFIGQTLHVLVGYQDRPTGIGLVFYGATILIIVALMRFAGGIRPPATISLATRSMS